MTHAAIMRNLGLGSWSGRFAQGWALLHYQHAPWALEHLGRTVIASAQFVALQLILVPVPVALFALFLQS